MTVVLDMPQRQKAVTEIGSSFLVEAGAGSGKTSILAARVIFMLASGIKPKNIAAITFTEAAASELLGRVSKGIEKAIAWNGSEPIGKELQTAFPDGVSDQQKNNLKAAKAAIGTLTISTIHGFCQRLIKPYPVEAGIDPGANIIAGPEAELLFEDVFNSWLRNSLAGEEAEGTLLGHMIAYDTNKALAAIRAVAQALRDPAEIEVQAVSFSASGLQNFLSSARGFIAWHDAIPYAGEVEGHCDIIEAFRLYVDVCGKINFDAPAQAIMQIIDLKLDKSIFKLDGMPKQYRFKTKWQGKTSKTLGETLCNEAAEHFERASKAFLDLREIVASAAIRQLTIEVEPLLEEYQKHKRQAALLDFDDLLRSALTMLQNFDAVKNALRDRYQHILIDEYQDTDPVQTEIVKLLTFDDDGLFPKPGALFLVGDPKQAIYRFRGANVETYIQMRETLRTYDPDCILSINVNFRSQRPILDYVNSVFRPLFEESPGFTELEAFHDHGPALGIAAVSWFPVTPASSDPSINDWRQGEAQIVADICSRLIGAYMVREKDGKERPCRPGDVALLVPQGTELYVYENALEEAGIPIASQAGKGIFRQQEIHDLIALTRIIADERDTLSLGAFLRGPLVGLTEQELLDQSHLLGSNENGRLNFLEVGMDTSVLTNEILRQTLDRLHALRTASLMRSPHDVLSEAVDVFMVRPKVRSRFQTSPERRLANVDHYLDMATAYGVRGIRAFSDAMRKAWEDAEKAPEGRPDGHENAVSFVTMHSAKGLEWPIVIPINTVTSFLKSPPLVKNSATATMTMPFFGVKPKDYAQAVVDNEQENRLERYRLWYVAMTRAQNLLLLPFIDGLKTRGEAWTQLLNLDIEATPRIELEAYEPKPYTVESIEENGETKKSFAAQSAYLADRQQQIVDFVVPSKHEWSPALANALSIDDLIDSTPDLDPYANIKGSKERGNILHKLMEEVLNGEIQDDFESLKSRASELIIQTVSKELRDLPFLYSEELARCVDRTLKLPLIQRIRPHLVPEVATTAFYEEDGRSKVVYGIVDAAEFHLTADSASVYAESIVDWKSDVTPSPLSIRNYKEQVGTYLKSKDVKKGYIVFMTTGEIIEVSRS